MDKGRVEKRRKVRGGGAGNTCMSRTLNTANTLTNTCMYTCTCTPRTAFSFFQENLPSHCSLNVLCKETKEVYLPLHSTVHSKSDSSQKKLPGKLTCTHLFLFKVAGRLSSIYMYTCMYVHTCTCTSSLYRLVALPCIPGFELSQLSCPGSSVGIRVLA